MSLLINGKDQARLSRKKVETKITSLLCLIKWEEFVFRAGNPVRDAHTLRKSEGSSRL